MAIPDRASAEALTWWNALTGDERATWSERIGADDPARAFAMYQDGQAGMRWWNGITAEDRSYWMERANSAAPSAAWEAFKTSLAKKR